MRTLNCKWCVGVHEIEWHRENVFNKSLANEAMQPAHCAHGSLVDDSADLDDDAKGSDADRAR